ncbi:hypothetical protein [Ureaplasma parvum]|uniref:DUF6856 family protein n=1 Tax=Ureaplasma parvum TaxID=134821 RepID=UPI000456499F|nr:hypothetical protein [Ureaplasma parvum]BAO73640.1 hypothetical protein UU403 [Ureaplasma parvum serovar 3]
MKKAILISISSLIGISAIVATSTFLSLSAKTNIYAKLIKSSDLNQSLNYTNLSDANIGIKEMLLGTNKINNGNYVLYIGTQSNLDNLNFVYDNQTNHINSISDLKYNDNLKFNGSLAKSINNVKNYADKGVYEHVPEFYSFIDLIDTNVFKQKQDYENLIKQNKSSTIKEDQNWANNAPTDYSFDVNKKYKDKSGREVYFRNDTQAVKFREILNFLKKYLSKEKLIELSTSQTPGIVLFYSQDNLSKGPQVYASSKIYDKSKNERKESYVSGDNVYNSSRFEFGGDLNAAIYSVYGKK